MTSPQNIEGMEHRCLMFWLVVSADLFGAVWMDPIDHAFQVE